MLPEGWTKYTTEDGKDYYHNHMTNATQWDTPTTAAIILPVVPLETTELPVQSNINDSAVKTGFELQASEGPTFEKMFGIKLPCRACLPSMDFLVRGFRVESAMVISRLKSMLLPLPTTLFDEKPDLYVPFWVVATEAFLFSFFLNLKNSWNTNVAIPD